MKKQINNHQTTKREKRLLKIKDGQREFLLSVRRQKIKKISIAILTTALLAGGIIFLAEKSSLKENLDNANADGKAPKAEVIPAEYDLGDISMAKGIVKKTFEIKNAGGGDLKIDSIWTSCHCTTAVLKIGEKNSPEFGMGTNSPFWSEKISGGETGYLEVSFDPAYHGPSGTGRAVRAVYLDTNNPQNKKLEARITANVLP